MGQFSFGEMLQQQRRKQGITQERLCEGLCDAATLSRIESGHQQPSRNLLVALLQRLGVVADRYYCLNKFEELEQEDLKQKIRSAGARFENKSVLQMLEEMQQKYDCTDSISRQFILCNQALCGRIVDGSLVAYSDEQRLDILQQAIECTVPKMDIECIEQFLMGMDELLVLMNIANTLEHSGQRRKAIHIYDQLLRYINKHWLASCETALFVPLLTYNYSRALGLEERFEEELEVVELGIESCREHGKSRMLGELLINKACALHRLGQVFEGQRTAVRSYYILSAMGMNKQAERVKQYLLETYTLVVD